MNDKTLKPEFIDATLKKIKKVMDVILEYHGVDMEYNIDERNKLFCEIIKKTKKDGGRIIAVGTTSVRTLETLGSRGLDKEVGVVEFSGPTNLFILPGYKFKIVDAMITNFHLPRSTLIMLVSAFVGRENILASYEIAKQEKYRFYSFGDAMLII